MSVLQSLDWVVIIERLVLAIVAIITVSIIWPKIKSALRSGQRRSLLEWMIAKLYNRGIKLLAMAIGLQRGALHYRSAHAALADRQPNATEEFDLDELRSHLAKEAPKQ